MTSKFDAVQPGKPQWYWHIGESQEEVVQVIRDGSGTLWANWGYGGSSKLPNGPRVPTFLEVDQLWSQERAVIIKMLDKLIYSYRHVVDVEPYQVAETIRYAISVGEHWLLERAGRHE